MDIHPRENSRLEHFLVGSSPVNERNERMEALETHRAREESYKEQCSG